MNPLQIPKLQYFVNDFSRVLSTKDQQTLDKVFVAHQSKTSEQVVTVLFPHRRGRELLDIGVEVFNENGIGQK